MNNNIGSGTAAGLVAYLDKIVEKGRAKPSSITPLKTAFVKVMQAVDGAEWGSVDIETINVDDHVLRFANLTSGTYTDSSISVYKSRMNRVISWYLKFKKQPGWMPLIQSRTPKKDAKSHADESSPNQEQKPYVTSPPTSLVASTTLTKDFGEGRIASLSIPSDITPDEREKLKVLIENM